MSHMFCGMLENGLNLMCLETHEQKRKVEHSTTTIRVHLEITVGMVWMLQNYRSKRNKILIYICLPDLNL